MNQSIRESLRHLASRSATSLPALAIMLSFTSGAQSALPPAYVAVGVDINSGVTGAITHDSGPQDVPLLSESGSGSGATANGSTVSSSGTASADEFGDLKVSVNDAVTTVPADWPAVSMVASAVADRVDTFHILPPTGTSYSFLATLEWSGPSTAKCPTGTDCITNIINHLNENGFVAMDNSLYYDSTDPLHRSLPASQSISQVWTFSSPASFVLDEQLILSVEVSAYAASASFGADLSHTGHFYLDPITPGATYTTASGKLYFTPTVPEPDSWSLLCAGLLAVFGFVARRNTTTYAEDCSRSSQRTCARSRLAMVNEPAGEASVVAASNAQFFVKLGARARRDFPIGVRQGLRIALMPTLDRGGSWPAA